MFRSDAAATRARIARLHAYMERHVLRGERFCCRHGPECSGSVASPGVIFSPGQLSHVGHRYDLSLAGAPLRVMVVGQEYGFAQIPGRRGADQSRVSLEERYRMVHDVAGLRRRYYRDGAVQGRNPHMRGTTSALRVLFGTGLGSNPEGEFVRTTEGDSFYVFDAFALVNVLLCSAHTEGSSAGRSSTTMRRNCLEHFAATVRILEPTIVVLQGTGVQRWLRPIIRPHAEVTRYLARAGLAGHGTIVCRFSHPAARGALRWGDRLDAPYLLGVVEPTLRRALELNALPSETASADRAP